MNYSQAIKEGGKPQITQGTATTVAVKTDTLPGSIAISLYNRSTSIPILYSIDGGTTYLSIPPFGGFDEYMDAPAIYLKTDSGSAAYDLKVALRQ